MALGFMSYRGPGRKFAETGQRGTTFLWDQTAATCLQVEHLDHRSEL